MTTYTTVQGDTWDGVAFKLYGDHGGMGPLIEANFPLLDHLVFPAGIVLNVPDIVQPVDERLPFWRR